jgi:endonuclease/exonuclease/phosphatase family metal-dependent hydrolase
MRSSPILLSILLLVACGGSSPSGNGQPPDTQLTAAPDSPVQSAQFTFTSDTAGAVFECSVDGGDFASCTSPASPSVEDGEHTFRVRAVDASGDADPTPASASWTQDTVPPETTITSETSSSASVDFAFSASEPDATFTCQLDEGAKTSCTSPVHYDATPGSHVFAVQATDVAGNVDPTPATESWSVAGVNGVRVRVMAANLTTGNYQSYDDRSSQGAGCAKSSGFGTGEGKRIFQGLAPDIVAIQEFNYFGCDGTNSEANVRAFVTEAFGSGYSYYREPFTAAGDLPNGIVSRYPILASGSWADPEQSQPNRGFAWAQIDLPGDQDLYVISVHLLTASESVRQAELNDLLGDISANFPPDAWVVLAGDFNTHARDEAGIQDATAEFVTAAPWPADGNGDGDTNSIRQYPDDWVLASSGFDALESPVVIGSSTFPDGLVFDSRVYAPLSEVSPVQQTDSDANGMQHMGVVRDFLVP